MTHIPTGIVAQCQDEKSQAKNREKCLRVLRSRIYEAAQEAQRAAEESERRSRLEPGTGVNASGRTISLKGALRTIALA